MNIQGDLLDHLYPFCLTLVTARGIVIVESAASVAGPRLIFYLWNTINPLTSLEPVYCPKVPFDNILFGISELSVIEERRLTKLYDLLLVFCSKIMTHTTLLQLLDKVLNHDFWAVLTTDNIEDIRDARIHTISLQMITNIG